MTTHTRMRPLMGTYVEITAEGHDATHAIDTAFSCIATIESLMSYYDKDSDITNINHLAPNTTITINPQTWNVLKSCEMLSRISNGLFDITVASKLVELGFLPPSKHQDGPMHWSDIILMDEMRVQVRRPLCIDLGGIAKGYAVDCAIEILKHLNMTSASVNAGGDMRRFGSHAQTLYIKHPTTPSIALPIIELHDNAAATSAGYYSQKKFQNSSVTPLINPLTHTSIPSEYSVTVLAESCMIADALTKIIHADPHGAKPILEKFNARAFLLKHDPTEGTVHIFDSYTA